MRLPCVELEISCGSEENLNHVLKTDGVKLFKDFLINNLFSKQIYLKILTWSFVWASMGEHQGTLVQN